MSICGKIREELQLNRRKSLKNVGIYLGKKEAREVVVELNSVFRFSSNPTLPLKTLRDLDGGDLYGCPVFRVKAKEHLHISTVRP